MPWDQTAGNKSLPKEPGNLTRDNRKLALKNEEPLWAKVSSLAKSLSWVLAILGRMTQGEGIRVR